MSGRWFRFYDSVPDDPKVGLLTPELFRSWVYFLCISSRNKGVIGDDLKALSYTLRVSKKCTHDYIQALVSVGLLDKIDGGWTPHNWGSRQYKSDVSTERVKRFRNVSKTVSETPPDTDTDTDTDKNMLLRNSRPKQVSDPPNGKTKRTRNRKNYPEQFQAFWAEYPTDPLMSKKRAADAFQKLTPEDAAIAIASMKNFRAYCAKHPDYRPVHAERYITQRRYDGFIGSAITVELSIDPQLAKMQALEADHRKVTP